MYISTNVTFICTYMLVCILNCRTKAPDITEAIATCINICLIFNILDLQQCKWLT